LSAVLLKVEINSYASKTSLEQPLKYSKKLKPYTGDKWFREVLFFSGVWV